MRRAAMPVRILKMRNGKPIARLKKAREESPDGIGFTFVAADPVFRSIR
jgi:hypothetical protein